MAQDIFAILRSKPYYCNAVDGFTVRKIALEWAIDAGEDIAKALSSDTINQVLACVAQDCA